MNTIPKQANSAEEDHCTTTTVTNASSQTIFKSWMPLELIADDDKLVRFLGSSVHHWKGSEMSQREMQDTRGAPCLLAIARKWVLLCSKFVGYALACLNRPLTFLAAISRLGYIQEIACTGFRSTLKWDRTWIIWDMQPLVRSSLFRIPFSELDFFNICKVRFLIKLVPYL